MIDTKTNILIGKNNITERKTTTNQPFLISRNILERTCRDFLVLIYIVGQYNPSRLLGRCVFQRKSHTASMLLHLRLVVWTPS